MNLAKILTAGILFSAISAASLRAQLVYSDGFEGYSLGGLDKNLGGGPNAAPNGSGNPWWGPFPPNMQVVGSGDGGVTAHSGSQMIRGNIAGNDFDQDYYNLAYRLNGGNAFGGNLAVDWWFYDPLGSGGAGYQDYMALTQYGNVPGNTDYPSGGSPSGITQRLSLGAASTTGADNTKYQARVVGASDGVNPNGWFNTSVTRTVGWHEARISLGDPNGANTLVSFYIDDMSNPVLVHSLMSTAGINTIELNGAFGATTGYYDDLAVSVVPEPGAAALLLCGGLIVWLARRAQQLRAHSSAPPAPDFAVTLS